MFLSLYTDKAKGILTEQRFVKLTAALGQGEGYNQKRPHDLLPDSIKRKLLYHF